MRKIDLCAYFRKRKYPQTGDGRRRYIEDSLNPGKKKNLICGLIFTAFIIGLLLVILCAIMTAR
jgi:hypothetical protein